jgi:hypothetical protein
MTKSWLKINYSEELPRISILYTSPIQINLYINKSRLPTVIDELVRICVLYGVRSCDITTSNFDVSEVNVYLTDLKYRIDMIYMNNVGIVSSNLGSSMSNLGSILGRSNSNSNPNILSSNSNLPSGQSDSLSNLAQLANTTRSLFQNLESFGNSLQNRSVELPAIANILSTLLLSNTNNVVPNTSESKDNAQPITQLPRVNIEPSRMSDDAILSIVKYVHNSVQSGKTKYPDFNKRTKSGYRKTKNYIYSLTNFLLKQEELDIFIDKMNQLNNVGNSI